MIEKHEILLSVKDVHLSFDGKKILENINFSVRDIINTNQAGQGQVISLLGRSGIGKSCLFNMIAGLIKADSGEILVNQNQLPVHPGSMGVVFQDYYFFGWKTVKKVLEMAIKKNILISGKEISNMIKQIAADHSG